MDGLNVCDTFQQERHNIPFDECEFLQGDLVLLGLGGSSSCGERGYGERGLTGLSYF